MNSLQPFPSNGRIFRPSLLTARGAGSAALSSSPDPSVHSDGDATSRVRGLSSPPRPLGSSPEHVRMEKVPEIARRQTADLCKMCEVSKNQATYDQLFLRWSASNNALDIPSVSTTISTSSSSGQYLHEPNPSSLDDLMAQAIAAEDTFRGFVESLKFQTEAKVSLVTVAPLKDADVLKKKVESEYSGKLGRIYDVVRASMVVSDLRNLMQLIVTIRALAASSPRKPVSRSNGSDKGSEKNTISVVRIKNGLAGPCLPGGYRDVKINLSVFGHICELQVHLQEFWGVLKDEGYANYKLAKAHGVAHLYDPFDVVRKRTPAVLKEMASLPENSQDNWRHARIQEAMGNLGEALALYQKALLSFQTSLGPDHPATLECVVSAAVVLRKQKKYSDAEKHYRRALEGCEKLLGSFHPHTLSLLNSLLQLLEAQKKEKDLEIMNKRLVSVESDALVRSKYPDASDGVASLAELLRTSGKGSEAEELFGRANAACKQVHGMQSAKSLRMLFQYGLLLWKMDKRKQSIKVLGSVYAGRIEVLGAKHPDTIKSICTLAAYLEADGSLKDAESLYKQALKDLDAALGPNSSDSLDVVNSLALLLKHQERYREAEPYYQLVVHINQLTYGQTHPITLTAMNGLAGIHQYQGKYNEAEKVFETVLAGRQQVLGPTHADTVSSMNNLAQAKISLNKLTQAEELMTKAVEIADRDLGVDHPDTMSYVKNVAVLLEKAGKLDQALQAHKRVAANRAKMCGQSDSSTLRSLITVSRLEQALGRHADAEMTLRKILEIREQSLAPNDVDLLTTLHLLGACYLKQNKLKEAESTLRTALERRVLTLGERHPKTLITHECLARTLSLLKQYTAAEDLYRKGIENNTLVYGENHPETVKCIGGLARVLEAQGKGAQQSDIIAKDVQSKVPRKFQKQHAGGDIRYEYLTTELRAAIVVQSYDASSVSEEGLPPS